MADTSIRTNSPDPTKYHPNVGGMPGTMLPRSGSDGQSLGFDHNRPQIVIVDPGELGGGFTLDMSSLSKLKQNFNSAAIRKEVASDVSSFYREISQRMINEPKAPAAPTIPSIQKAQVVPEPLKPLSSLPPVSVVQEIESPESISLQIDTLLQEEFNKASALRQQFNNPTAPVQPQPSSPSLEAQQLRLQVAQQTAMINSMVSRLNMLTDKAVVPETKPVEPVTPPVDVDAILSKAFQGLQIPFFNSDKPERPQYETYFEMAKMGTMAARYHAVILGQDCLALVYDTRFADGFQYLPPNLGEELITVSVPKLKEANCVCSSLGLHWTLGCLDVVILIRHKGEV
jgi:hypothetical protein